MILHNDSDKLMDVSDVSFPRYMLDLVKNTTRAERISCIVALLLIVTCIVLIVYFTVIVKKPMDDGDQGETFLFLLHGTLLVENGGCSTSTQAA